ncbi:MAG TPA: leucine-rich repeat domain-containing protein [Polyangiaceae bacterium]|nr:leucine-rich repeat domain-containing protein [Polyangiaceae bacterium]
MNAHPPHLVSTLPRFLAIIALASLCSCEEKPSPSRSASSTPSAVTKAPEVPSVVASVTAPEPSAAPRKTKTKKLASDCPKGMPVLDNPDVEAAIRLKAQKPKGPLTIGDLKKVRSLNISQAKISELDLCLFQHLTELRELFIGRGEVDDIGAIAGLTKLESLRLSLNPITDLSPLAKMTKLDRVDLAHTQVKDLSPLTAATGMTELLLDDTQVADVSPLAKLEKLEVLVLKNTQVKDLAPLKGLKALKTLDIRGTQVEDTSVVARPGLRIQQM